MPTIYQIQPVIRPSIRAFVTFLTNARPLKLLGVATSTHNVEGTGWSFYVKLTSRSKRI